MSLPICKPDCSFTLFDIFKYNLDLKTNKSSFISNKKTKIVFYYAA